MNIYMADVTRNPKIVMAEMRAKLTVEVLRQEPRRIDIRKMRARQFCNVACRAKGPRVIDQAASYRSQNNMRCAIERLAIAHDLEFVKPGLAQFQVETRADSGYCII